MAALRPQPREAEGATAKTATSALNDRQLRFIEEYLVDMYGREAAIRAGYRPRRAEKRASRLLSTAKVQRAVSEAQEAGSERVSITADYVLEGIRDTIDRYSQSAPVLDRQGRPITVQISSSGVGAAFTFDLKGVLKGFELLGRHLKLFTDKQELTGRNGGLLEGVRPRVVVDL